MKIGLIGYGRFDSKVEIDPTSGCWKWLGYKVKGGYGRFWFEGRDVMAHRFAYELVVGPIPEGKEPDHTCNNPGCVNPGHLEIKTHRENSLRSETSPTAINSRKTHCPENHEYTPENTYIIPSTGSRRCRKCHNARNVVRIRQRRQEEKAA